MYHVLLGCKTDSIQWPAIKTLSTLDTVGTHLLPLRSIRLIFTLAFHRISPCLTDPETEEVLMLRYRRQCSVTLCIVTLTGTWLGTHTTWLQSVQSKENKGCVKMYICILYVSQEIGLDASIVRGHGYMSSSVGSLGVGSGSFTIQHIYISTYLHIYISTYLHTTSQLQCLPCALNPDTAQRRLWVALTTHRRPCTFI